MAQAETEFNGSICFTSANAACQAEGWNSGACFAIRYAPRNIGTNGANTELSLFNRTFAVGFQMNSGNPVSATPITVSMAKVARGGYSYDVGFRFISQSPASPTQSTANITFTGQFTNWDEIIGCTIQFRGAATRQ